VGAATGVGAMGGRGIRMLDGEFVESDIDALGRISHEPDTSLPSWTITK
jgi:hypothetical protein